MISDNGATNNCLEQERIPQLSFGGIRQVSRPQIIYLQAFNCKQVLVADGQFQKMCNFLPVGHKNFPNNLFSKKKQFIDIIPHIAENLGFCAFIVTKTY